MKVKFKATYFSSSSPHDSYGRIMSGRRYSKNKEYDLSDEQYEQAVKDGAHFYILSGKVPKEEKPEPITLKEADNTRHAADEVQKLFKEADKTDDENKVKRGRGRPRKS